MRSELFAFGIGINQYLRMKRLSKTQKRVRARSKGVSKDKQRKSAAKKKLRAKALHLLLGPEHFDDRLAAERLRQHPHVPRKKQSSFPRDVEVGFAGHYQNGKFKIQGREEFVRDFECNAEDAWYLRLDKRGNRKPRREDSGMFETNAALSTGLSMVLAGLVRDGQLNYVRNTVQLASEAGMTVVRDRTGYQPGYLSIHPDAEGTLSTHYGSWTVDPNQRKLLGISATGKRGRKGPKNLGSSFISILRHDRAIGLPADLTRMPKKNLEERNPLDWAISNEMDRIVREELVKLPNGQELLTRADEYQREAAEDWLRRYRTSKAGVDKGHAELVAARKRIAELEAAVSSHNANSHSKKKLLPLRRGISGVRKMSGFLGDYFKKLGRFIEKVHRSIPCIEITYSVPSWMKMKTKVVDTFNSQQSSVVPTQHVRGSAIALESIHQPIVTQTLRDNSHIVKETDMGVKKPSVNPLPARTGKDDPQMDM